MKKHLLNPELHSLHPHLYNNTVFQLLAPLRATKNTLQHIVKMDSKCSTQGTVQYLELNSRGGGRECECEEYFTVSQLSQN